MLRLLTLQLLFRVAMSQGMFDMFGFGGNAAADPFGFGGAGGTFDPYMSGGGGGGMMDPYMAADPYMGGGLGFQSVTPDPVAAHDARLTLAEEQMAEVLGESARNSPERRRVESLIQASGGQFTGDAANLNYLVQEYQMTTPGPMPTPEGEPQTGGGGFGPNNGGGRGQGGRRRNNRGRNINNQGNGNHGGNVQNGPNQRNQGNGAGNRAAGGRVMGPSNRPRNNGNGPNNQQTNHDPYLQGNGPSMQPYNDPYMQGNGAGNNPSFGQNNILNGGNGPNNQQPYNDPYAQGNNQGNQMAYGNEPVTPPTTVAYNDPYMSGGGAGNQASLGNNQSPQPTNNYNAGNGPSNQQQYQEPNWQGNSVQNQQNGMGRSNTGPKPQRPQPANNFNARNGPNNQQQYQEPHRQGNSVGNNAPNQQAYNQQPNPSPGPAGASNDGTILPANQPGKAKTVSKQGSTAAERLRGIETRIGSINDQIQQARMSNDIPKIENLEKQLTALNGVKMILSGGKSGTNSMETIQGIPQDQQTQQPPNRAPFGPPKRNRNGNTGNTNSQNNNFQETNVGGGQWDSNWNSNTPSPQRPPPRQQNGKVNFQPYESTTPPYSQGVNNQQMDPYNQQQPPYEPYAGQQMGPTEPPMNQQIGGGGGQGRRQGGGRRRNRNNRRNPGMQQNGPTTATPNLYDVRWIGNEKYIYMDADNAEGFQWVKASTVPKSQLDHLTQEGQGQGNTSEAPPAPA